MNGAERYLISWLRPQATKGLLTPFGDVVALGTRTGRTHKSNQDRIVFARFGGAAGGSADACVICDGMGGMEEGERCSELAVATFVVALAAAFAGGATSRGALREAAHQANARLHAEFRGRGGSTLAAILVEQGAAVACCVGDTRVFAVNAAGVRQLSRDDTVKGALVAYGVRPANGTTRVPEHDRLVQFLGMGGDLEPHVFDVEGVNDARFLLACSDGAYRIPDPMFSTIASNAPAPRQLVERLLSVSDWLGGTDDASAFAFDARLVTEYVPHHEVLPGVIALWGPKESGVVMQPPRYALGSAPRWPANGDRSTSRGPNPPSAATIAARSPAHEAAVQQPAPQQQQPETPEAGPSETKAGRRRNRKRPRRAPVPTEQGELVIKVVEDAAPNERAEDHEPDPPEPPHDDGDSRREQ